jgi:hypothetical protein
MDSAAILEILDDHGFEHITDAKKIRFVNYALNEILDTEDWPFLLSEESTATGAATEKYSITGLWKSIISMNDTTNSRILIPMERQSMLRRWPGELTTPGKPLYYWFANGTDSVHEMDINLYPIPDAAYTIRVTYKLGQVDLGVADAEGVNVLPPKYHMLIVHRALAHLYAQDDELDNSGYFMNQYEQELLRVRMAMHTTQLDRPRYVATDHFPDGGFTE